MSTHPGSKSQTQFNIKKLPVKKSSWRSNRPKRSLSTTTTPFATVITLGLSDTNAAIA